MMPLLACANSAPRASPVQPGPVNRAGNIIIRDQEDSILYTPPQLCPVILAGGASARLWPVSDTNRPKWDLRLFGQRTLLQEAWRRARAVARAPQCLVVAGSAHARRIRASLPELPRENLLVEPAARDTAGALAYAAGVLLRARPRGVLLVLPGDHVIEPLERFVRCARTAARVAEHEGALVTFGIQPRAPATCYGYVRRGAPLETARAGEPRAFRVRAFKEKPDAATAQAYLASGEYYWNGGIFAFPIAALLAELEAHLPEHAALAKALAVAGSRQARTRCLRARFPRLPKVSIDFGVMEHARNVATIAADFNWDDIGSWTAVGAHLERREENACGPAVDLRAIDSSKNVVVAPGKQVALIGVSGLAVVQDGQRLLVCRLDQDQRVKEVAQRAGTRRRQKPDPRITRKDANI